MGCHCARCSMHDVWGCEEAACSAFAEQDPAVRWHCDDPASGGGDGAPGRTRRKLAQKFIPEIHRLLQERVSIEKKRAVGKDRNLSETFGDSSRRLKGNPVVDVVEDVGDVVEDIAEDVEDVLDVGNP